MDMPPNIFITRYFNRLILMGGCHLEDTNLEKSNVRTLKLKEDLIAAAGIFILLFLSVLFSILLYYINSEKDKVALGTAVSIEDRLLPLGGLTLEEALGEIDLLVSEYLDSAMELSKDGIKVDAKLKDLGVYINREGLMEEIKSSVYGPYLLESLKRHRHYERNIAFMNYIDLDAAITENFAREYLKEIEKEPQNARLFFNKEKDQVELNKAVIGCRLDLEGLISSLGTALREYKWALNIPTIPVDPDITDEKALAMMPKELMSSFSTRYGGSGSGRKTNIRLATSFINNALLAPGEEFDYYEYVGNPTASRGFKPAAIYKNGEVVQGIGGGLCQVSTTLYNAALLADLEITERSPHGMPVGYVPLGRDATVSYGYRTLKFKNNTDGYILIKGYANGSTLTFEIYGDKVEGKEVKVYSKVVAHNTADAYRVVYMNGEEVRRDFLGRDRYKSLKTSQ